VSTAACSGLPLLEGGPGTHAVGEGGELPEAGQGESGCGDTMASADNCGACGHKCIIGTCSAGHCQPQAILTGPTLPNYAGYVGVTSSRVVWANAATRGVYGVPKVGGTFQQYFGTTAFTPTTLDVHETFFVVADYDFYGVARFAVAGGGYEDPKAETCATGLGAIADDTGAVYYAHLSDVAQCNGVIFHITKRIPSGGGAYTTAWDIPISAFDAAVSKWMALDATNLYFDSYTMPNLVDPIGIYSVPRAGGTPSLLLAGGFLSSPKAVDGGMLYTIEDIFSATPAVVAIDLKTKGKRVVKQTTNHAFFDGGNKARAQIAVDATHVYWTAALGSENPSVLGRVLRTNKDGSGPLEVVVDNEPSLYGMAIDESFVYWSTATAIKRVAK
jgi:hypothetical protein